MAKKQQPETGPWILEAMPLLAVVLMGVHVLALVYWMYRLATDKQSQKKKLH